MASATGFQPTLTTESAADEALDLCYHLTVGDRDPGAKRWLAAEALRRHDPALARQAAEILQRRIAGSGVLAEKRNRNIALLAGLGDEYKPAAAALALRMLLDPEAGPEGVQYAAEQLARLGSEHAQAAAHELERLAQDPGTRASSLVSIAGTLRSLNRDAAAVAAVAAVRRAMADPSLTAWDTILAAHILSIVDRQYHEETAAIYRGIIDGDAPAGERALAAGWMAVLGEERKREGVAALRALAADPALTDDELRAVAEQLAGIGPEYRKEAEEMLRL
jgi:hypothetical protein